MRQRIITVPKDRIAENALDFDETSTEQLIELSISEEQFRFMYQNGIIELINHEGGSNIDDYEDDCVSGKESLIKVLLALKLKDDVNGHHRLIQSISNLFEEAINRGTGVYFYF